MFDERRESVMMTDRWFSALYNFEALYIAYSSPVNTVVVRGSPAMLLWSSPTPCFVSDAYLCLLILVYLQGIVEDSSNSIMVNFCSLYCNSNYNRIQKMEYSGW